MRIGAPDTNGLRRKATATPVDCSRPGAAYDVTAAFRYAVRLVSVDSSPENRRLHPSDEVAGAFAGVGMRRHGPVSLS